MEISEGLQLEIHLVQNKLKNAIRDHQICVGKLKDDPNNVDILIRIKEIQFHIVNLGRLQKDIVQRLREEVEAFKAENANEVKVSVASLLGFNNNNHITANNEATTDEISEVKVVTNGLDNDRLTAAKEDYEAVVLNGNVTRSPRGKVRKKERSISVETISTEDVIMEVFEVDDNSRDKQRHEPESSPSEPKLNCKAQLNFLEILGLITTSKFTELQNKRAERKRRSTANPQFVYSNWEIPTKRKRHNYLQSATNVPQTRQTTARLNGPSPPPTTNKPTSTVPPPKSTSPPTRTIAKSLIPTQKATARPNILRNMAESRVFANKGRIENGNGQSQLSSSTKTTQSTTNSKTVHIPGLPLGLTIERIENDSAVCINCRNPGTLTNCDNCEANYHVSCHTISPPPPRLCPKCALRLKDASASTTATTTATTTTTTTTIKKNEELVAASYAPGVAGKAGEDPEINKTSCGFYKIGTAAKQQQQQQQQQPIISSGRGFNHLPSSTFLIPISSNTLAATSNFNQSDKTVITDSSPLEIVKSSSNNDSTVVTNTVDEIGFNSSLVIGHQMSRSNVTYVPQPQLNVSYGYQLPVGTSDTSQSYFIVKKITEPRKSNGQEGKTIATTSGYDISRGRETNIGKSKISNSSIHLDKLTGRLAESIARGWKKSTTRAIPGLNRIVSGDGKSVSITTEHTDNDNVDKLSNVTYNGGIEKNRQYGGNNAGNFERRIEEKSRDAREFIEITDKRVELEITSSKQTEQNFHGRKKFRSKSHSGLLYSMFSGYNKPDNVADRCDESQQRFETIVNDGNDGNDGKFGNSRRNESHEHDDKFHSEQSMGKQQSNCSEFSSSTEHVKLEEAHLSAPFRAKLRCDDDKIVVNNCQPIKTLRNLAKNVSNRRRTTEDRVRTSPIIRTFDISKQERNRPRILMRNERISLDSRDIIAISETKNLKSILNSSDTDSADEDFSTDAIVSDRTGFKNLVAACQDDENERKDFNSEERETESNEEDVDDSIGEVDDEEVDEEDDEGIEEEEEEDQEDCPILDEDINDRVNERLGINTVSTESMQVLEQFESAMLQVENGDSTAKR